MPVTRLVQVSMLIIAAYSLQSCHTSKKAATNNGVGNPSGSAAISLHTRISRNNIAPVTINTKNVTEDSLVAFAETLIGIKYKYGSSDKDKGFDCSGFINYVFNHFKIKVPRSSVEFTNAGTTIDFKDCKKADLILFTGTDTTGWIVGHMGIITENKRGRVRFIHSASGNGKGVMISDMSSYFITRYVKVIRIFK